MPASLGLGGFADGSYGLLEPTYETPFDVSRDGWLAEGAPQEGLALLKSRWNERPFS